jgi:hypothetical protein
MDRGGRKERQCRVFCDVWRALIVGDIFLQKVSLKVRAFRESGWHHGYVYIRPWQIFFSVGDFFLLEGP